MRGMSEIKLKVCKIIVTEILLKVCKIEIEDIYCSSGIVLVTKYIHFTSLNYFLSNIQNFS